MLQNVFNVTEKGICGHCVLATITGLPLNTIIEKVGHDHGTHPKELAAVLCRLGYSCDSRRRTVSKNGLPPRAIVALTSETRSGKRKKGKWHWMLWWDDHFYDSCFGVDPDLEKTWGRYKRNPKVTSYLEIHSCPKY